MAPDPIIAETQRVYDELNEAKAAVVGVAAPDPFAKARADRAMAAAHDHRKMLRQVGQFFGDRSYPDADQLAAGVDPNTVAGLRVADNETKAPTILEVSK